MQSSKHRSVRAFGVQVFTSYIKYRLGKPLQKGSKCPQHGAKQGEENLGFIFSSWPLPHIKHFQRREHKSQRSP